MNEENEQFSETVRKMLEIMEYDTPYTRKTLMEKLGLKSRDGFRRNYLQPALEMNLIQTGQNHIIQLTLPPHRFPLFPKYLSTPRQLPGNKSDSCFLSKRYIQNHHQRKAYSEEKGSNVGVFSGRHFRYKLFYHYIEHSSGSEA